MKFGNHLPGKRMLIYDPCIFFPPTKSEEYSTGVVLTVHIGQIWFIARPLGLHYNHYVSRFQLLKMLIILEPHDIA